MQVTADWTVVWVRAWPGARWGAGVNLMVDTDNWGCTIRLTRRNWRKRHWKGLVWLGPVSGLLHVWREGR